ncbi:hypothetical protein GWI33_002934, partial [Rhynchophorus ferrugineus]
VSVNGARYNYAVGIGERTKIRGFISQSAEMAGGFLTPGKPGNGHFPRVRSDIIYQDPVAISYFRGYLV